MKKIYLFLILLQANFIFSQNLIFKEQPRWTRNLDIEDIENRLRNEKIIAAYELKLFTQLSKENKYFFENNRDQELVNFSPDFMAHAHGHRFKSTVVILESGLRAVFKDKARKNYAEAAAYKASKFLNFWLVPPTVMRQINNHAGILQLYVESDFSYNKRKEILQNNSYKNQKINNIKFKRLSDLAAFAFIFGQSDVSSNNTMMQTNDDFIDLALIDNEIIYFLNKTKNLRKAFRLWGKDNTSANYLNDQTFDYDIETHISLDNIKSLVPELSHYLSRKELKAILWCLRKIDKPIRYSIWQNSLWLEDFLLYKPKVRMIRPLTRRKLKALNNETMTEFWSDALLNATVSEKEHINKLIKSTLERRDLFLTKLANRSKMGLKLKRDSTHSTRPPLDTKFG